METKKVRRIALIIKTEGLEYDDRVRKEIQTIQRLFPDIRFNIFAMLPDNKEKEGKTGYGVPYKSVYIPARNKYPSASRTTLKAYQFYQAVKNEVKGYDAVWVANVDAAFVPMFLKHKRILWDLHELPLRFLGNWPMRMWLCHTFNRCKVVLHANTQREQYLEDMGVVKETSKHYTLRNYPNFEDVDTESDVHYQDFLEWKGSRKCVYLQGLNMDRRAPFESISAIMAIPDMCAVVVGGFNDDIKKRLDDTYGPELNKRVSFVGKIPQLKIPQYVSQCVMSLVFYKNVQPNNWYCEANRFYQSVIMGLPVVTGNNPSMKEFVDKYSFGISIDDDGSDTEKIISGIKSILKDYDYYHQNSIKNRDKLMWSNQENVIKEIVDTLFK